MVIYSSAHPPSHTHAENRSPNDDEVAKIGHFLRTRPCVLDVRCAATKNEICMIIFSFGARAGRLPFMDLLFPYIDLAGHVFVVSVLFIFLTRSPQETL